MNEKIWKKLERNYWADFVDAAAVTFAKEQESWKNET